MNRGAFLTAASLTIAAAVGAKVAVAALRVHVGDTLHSGTGSWLGNPYGFRYAFEHHRLNTSDPWVLMQEGASDSYILAQPDIGYAVRVRVTAYNADGASKPAASAPTGTVRRR
jgi:hypothetical protein